MLSIAICDNEPVICDQMNSFLDQYREEKDISFESRSFLSGEALYNTLAAGVDFDLIFLDIEMYHISGIDVAKAIRESKKDLITQIVYISAKQEYAMELFETHPLNFLMKPLKYAAVASCIDKTLKMKKERGDVFTYTSGGLNQRVPFSNILYFESMNRKVRMICPGQRDEFYGKLGDVISRCQGKHFVQIHKSYVVNLGYISKVGATTVEMFNGDVLPLSRDRRTMLTNAILESHMGEDD